jgi:predicted GNAT family acetyltransferase
MAATYRVLAGDDDWRQAESLRMAAAEQDTAEHAEFNRARIASERALTEAGHGAWWGAFLDGQLLASLGVIPIGGPASGERSLARYQHVETHPGFRRQGLAGTLAWHAGQSALTSGAAGTLVIVADPADVAIRVYRSVGFAETERQYAFARPPAEEARPCDGSR